MLVYTALCLAVTLASGQEPTPVWSRVYSFRMDYYLPGDDYHSTNTHWYDGNQNRFRIDDHSAGHQHYCEANATDLKYSQAVVIQPFTNEVQTNLLTCTIYHVYYGDPYMLPDIVKDQYTYIGQERMHGEDSSHWQRIEQEGDVIVYEYNIWVTLKNGVYTPLKLENKVHDTKQGILLRHDYSDIYDFDISPIDPKIWDIADGHICKLYNSHDKAMNFLRPLQNDKDHDRIHNEFVQFKIKFNKAYQSEEEHKKRLEIFKDNLKFINEHNKAGHSFKLRVNHLADLTEEERAMMRGRKNQTASRRALPFPYTAEEIEELSQDLPKEFDWRPHGAVTPVKNQRLCGSCWAFSAVGAVEGALFLHEGREQLMRLSEQALVDCSWGFDNDGCFGGYPWQAFEWMMKHGLPTDDAYGGYIARNGLCHIDSVRKAATVKAYHQVPVADEKALQVALFKHGPISVGIDTDEYFDFYSHGVFYSPQCSSDQDALGHAVLLVGYGVLDGEKYWLIKNSWGASWGADGYILMSTKDNNCGVGTEAIYVELE